MIGRAMTLTGEHVFFAGPPSLVNERQAFHLPDDPEVLAKLRRQVEALDGKLGGRLWAVSKKDGKTTARWALDSPPVFDGMVAAAGRLYAATMDGHVLCLSGDGSTALTRIDAGPFTTAWDHAEDPGYLKPASPATPAVKRKGPRRKK
jgi:outer membrane protein assembly factor BamB